LWLPFMALASAAMLTIVSGIAVMTRAPRAMVVVPAAAPETPAALEARRQQIERDVIEAKARMEAQQRALCRAPVRRGNLDGEAQPYDECIVPATVTR
jgi:hypothetical protein